MAGIRSWIGRSIVCLRHDDRAAFDPFAVGTAPAFPDTREGKWPIIRDCDEKRLLPAGWRLCPFVEAVGDDGAAALLEGVTERRFFGDCLARALIILEPAATSFAQNGTKPQRSRVSAPPARPASARCCTAAAD
jgi:hypothetical protein